MEDTITKPQVSEEEQDNQRFEELRKKGELNEEEQKEMDGLKQRHSEKVQRRIDEAVSRAKAAEYKYGEASREVEELRSEIEKLKEEKSREPVKIVQDYVDIAGKRYPTDDTLISMVKNKELTDAEAYKLQRQRDKAELREEIEKDLLQNQKQTEEQRVRADDQAQVLREYPQFSNRHPDFNPDDPLYKEVNRLWNNGYAANPKGLSLAIEDAKKILRLNDRVPDVTDELGVRSSTVPGRNEKAKDVPLTEEEKDAAIRMYTMGEAPPTNPKTGRPYTQNEAVQKAQDAKNRRQSRRIS